MESKGRDFRGTRHKGTTSATGRSTITGRPRQNGWNLDTLPPLPPFFFFLYVPASAATVERARFLTFFSFSPHFTHSPGDFGCSVSSPFSALHCYTPAQPWVAPLVVFCFSVIGFRFSAAGSCSCLPLFGFPHPHPPPLRMPPSVRGAVLAFSRSHAHYGFLLRWHSSVFSQRKTSPARADKLLGFIVLCFSATCELFLFFLFSPLHS